MGKRIDLTGQKFGKLTVLEDVGRTNGKNVIWKCLCECGNITHVVSSKLQSGHTKSCGCLHKNYLTGQVFGRLTVLEDVGRKHGKGVWKCLCECGNTVNVIAGHLQSGNTQSCGCLRKNDLIGEIFGRLTILEDVGRDKHGRVLWKCLCECGNTVDVRASSLQCGETQSCGCYNKERLSETHSGENSFHWKGGITPLNKAVRNSTFYKRWRTLVFQRDNFTCGHCHVRGGKLYAHHLNLFSVIIEEHNITTLEEALQCEALWDVSNGLTLCKKCHKKLHKALNKSQIIM